MNVEFCEANNPIVFGFAEGVQVSPKTLRKQKNKEQPKGYSLFWSEWRDLQECYAQPASSLIVCPSCLRQGEPTRDGLFRSSLAEIPENKKITDNQWLSVIFGPSGET